MLFYLAEKKRNSRTRKPNILLVVIAFLMSPLFKERIYSMQQVNFKQKKKTKTKQKKNPEAKTKLKIWFIGGIRDVSTIIDFFNPKIIIQQRNLTANISTDKKSQLLNSSNNCKPSSQTKHIPFYKEYFRILNTSLQTSNNPNRFCFFFFFSVFFFGNFCNCSLGPSSHKNYRMSPGTKPSLNQAFRYLQRALASRRSYNSELFIHQSLCNFPNTSGDQDDFSYLMLHLLKWLKRL